MKKSMHDIIKPAAVLFIICLVITASLAVTHEVTLDSIAQRTALDAENARKQVLVDADTFEEIQGVDGIIADMPELDGIMAAYRGKREGTFCGYVLNVTAKGYGGDIFVTVGIDREGKLSGVKIGDNQETPGLGSKAAEQPFLSQLAGFAPEQPLEVVKGGKARPEEIDALSGATITSRAVVKAVQAAVDMGSELQKGGDGK